jgi:hypothetical protein
MAKVTEGYRGFPSKAAYEAYYSDPKNYVSEIPAMEAYAKEAEAERRKCTYPDCECAIAWAGEGPVPETVCPLTACPPCELLAAAKNAAATLVAIYDWVDQIEQAGGATSMTGIAKCHAMLKSLRRNSARVEELVLAPLRKAIADAEKTNAAG